jgi:hypothetical protein
METTDARCQSHGWVDAEGKPLDPAAETAGKQVAA